MRIVLFGPPGAGKGSLALLCQTRLGIPHISTGEIFRREMRRHSALGRRVKAYVTAGRLVPDALVVRVMASRLSRRMLAKGFVCDGFPRTRGQACGFDRVLSSRGFPLDGAVYLTSPQALLIRRLSGRRVCERCGANFHLRTMRPKRAGVCDRCGARLTVRKDDQPATIRKRLRIDHTAAASLLAYYRRRRVLYRVNGIGHIHVVFHRAVRLFHRQGWVG